VISVATPGKSELKIWLIPEQLRRPDGVAADFVLGRGFEREGECGGEIFFAVGILA